MHDGIGFDKTLPKQVGYFGTRYLLTRLEVRHLQANAKYQQFRDVHRIAWHF
jgi:hypothetical protein